ncbi:DUF6582 domain-containing protein [Lapillicoccus sp.]|uniref:DUF6582 domain-containing protein n=1 Tax=Lapillicoccus sp. TaxID=1909287 RepID=UPI00326765C8
MSKDLSDADSRDGLEDGSFALPDERKCPILDVAHVRNALARVAQDGTAQEQKTVRAAVEKRYPSLKESDKD